MYDIFDKALNCGETYKECTVITCTHDMHVVHVWYVNCVYNISCSKYRKIFTRIYTYFIHGPWKLLPQDTLL